MNVNRGMIFTYKRNKNAILLDNADPASYIIVDF